MADEFDLGVSQEIRTLTEAMYVAWERASRMVAFRRLMQSGTGTTGATLCVDPDAPSRKLTTAPNSFSSSCAARP